MFAYTLASSLCSQATDRMLLGFSVSVFGRIERDFSMVLQLWKIFRVRYLWIDWMEAFYGIALVELFCGRDLKRYVSFPFISICAWFVESKTENKASLLLRRWTGAARIWLWENALIKSIDFDDFVFCTTESKSILLIRTFCYNLFLAATTIIFAIISWLYFRLLSPQPKLAILYRKKISISIKNTGIRQLSDQSIYPKKDGILIPFSSAMERTIKFGALPI